MNKQRKHKFCFRRKEMSIKRSERRKRNKEERERKKNALIGSQPQAILKAEKRERDFCG